MISEVGVEAGVSRRADAAYRVGEMLYDNFLWNLGGCLKRKQQDANE